MIKRAYFMHYRVIQEVVTSVVTIGAAFLAAYLILWARP